MTDTERAVCSKHGCELEPVECMNCDDGFSDHDCGEDCCCCLHPEPNVRCDFCNGRGSYVACPVCNEESNA